jgi:ribonuclease P protein component
MTGSDERFRPGDRLRKPGEFDRVFRQRCSVKGQYLVVHAARNDHGHPRLGRMIGKRWGTAAVRNRYRRWIREAFRQTRAIIPENLDLVVTLQRSAGLTFRAVKEELPRLAQILADRLPP